MLRRRPSTLALARLLAATMIGVVAAFLSVAGVGAWTSRKVDSSVTGIIDNAMPSVRYLSIARGDLHKLDLEAGRLALNHGDDGPTRVATLYASRTAVDEALDHYILLPTFEGEPAIRDRMLGELRSLDTEIAGFIDAVDRGDRGEVPSQLSKTRARAARIDDLLEQLVELNASRGAQLGLEAREAHMRTRHLVLVLDTMCVVFAVLATVFSVTWMRRIVRSLEEGNRLAEERAATLELRSSELDQFAGRVAHDLLNPLSAPAYALELLRREHPDEEKREKIAVIGLSGLRRARELVTGLLDFARAGASRIAEETAAPADVLADAIETVREDAAGSGVDVGVDRADRCVVACSSGVLTSLLGNLLRNGVKHMGDSPVRQVRARILSGPSRCRIEVIDTGPGVPEPLREAIFEPFTRGPTAAPGVGLGLATVKRLATAHGGSAGYERREDRSVFWVELPTSTAPIDATRSPEPPVVRH